MTKVRSRSIALRRPSDPIAKGERNVSKPHMCSQYVISCWSQRRQKRCPISKVTWKFGDELVFHGGI